MDGMDGNEWVGISQLPFREKKKTKREPALLILLHMYVCVCLCVYIYINIYIYKSLYTVSRNHMSTIVVV